MMTKAKRLIPARPLPALLLFGLTLMACGTSTTEPPPDEQYVPGHSYSGRNGYIEYIAGNSPVIISVPHGGDLTPAEIPDRVPSACGGVATTLTDPYTIEVALLIQQAFFSRFGSYPHLIINHLARTKLDPNREDQEATCGDPNAEIAFQEWYQYIDLAEADVLRASGKGWYIDLHANGLPERRINVGYLLPSADLNQSDATLDGDPHYERKSSIWRLSEEESISFSALLRGPTSFGSLYAAQGFPAIPSVPDPSPGSTAYLEGGTNTVRNGCGESAAHPHGEVCGVQIEVNYYGGLDTPDNRSRLALATVNVLQSYLSAHLGINLSASLVNRVASGR